MAGLWVSKSIKTQHKSKRSMTYQNDQKQHIRLKRNQEETPLTPPDHQSTSKDNPRQKGKKEEATKYRTREEGGRKEGRHASLCSSLFLQASSYVSIFDCLPFFFLFVNFRHICTCSSFPTILLYSFIAFHRFNHYSSAFRLGHDSFIICTFFS